MKGAKVLRGFLNAYDTPQNFVVLPTKAQCMTFKNGEESELCIPVRVVEMRKEAFEALVEKAATALAIRQNNGEPTDSDGRKGLDIWVKEHQDELRGLARAALSAVFGKGGKP